MSGTISERLCFLREKFTGEKLSLRDFHKRIGGAEVTSYSNVQKYDVDRDPPAWYLARVADTFGIDLYWLITGEGGPAGTSASGEITDLIDQGIAESVTQEMRWIAEHSTFLRWLEMRDALHVIESAHEALRGGLGSIYPDGYGEAREAVRRELDAMLHTAWSSWAGLRTAFDPTQSATRDELTRFALGTVVALRSAVPDRGIPHSLPEASKGDSDA